MMIFKISYSYLNNQLFTDNFLKAVQRIIVNADQFKEVHKVKTVLKPNHLQIDELILAPQVQANKLTTASFVSAGTMIAVLLLAQELHLVKDIQTNNREPFKVAKQLYCPGHEALIGHRVKVTDPVDPYTSMVGTIQDYISHNSPEYDTEIAKDNIIVNIDNSQRELFKQTNQGMFKDYSEALKNVCFLPQQLKIID